MTRKHGEYTYDSREPLECCEFPLLRKKIGVCVSEPFEGSDKQQYVEFESETVAINTKASGGTYPFGLSHHNKIRCTEHIIRDLDKAIEELAAHRNRLAIELNRLQKETVTNDDTKQPSRLF